MLLVASFSFAQNNGSVKETNYLRMQWSQVAIGMPSDWYGSADAQKVAENVLISQREIGGWAKNQPYHHTLSEAKKAEYLEAKKMNGATIDNGSTTMELRFLAKVYTKKQDKRYRDAFIKGFDYILMAQYDNGGWPQFYPVEGFDFEAGAPSAKNVPYYVHITYNDNAMVNVMTLLKEIYSDDPEFVALKIDSGRKQKAMAAFNKGVNCMLKTQIMVNGKPTVWCAQHHYKTLAPVKARSYELESFSGAESVGIVALLMGIDQPSEEVIAAVRSARDWFEGHKIEGIKLAREKKPDGSYDRRVLEDAAAPALWARFYDLNTELPYFCDRDGVKKSTLAEIGFERRNGYSWYTNAPQRILDNFPQWEQKWAQSPRSK